MAGVGKSTEMAAWAAEHVQELVCAILDIDNILRARGTPPHSREDGCSGFPFACASQSAVLGERITLEKRRVSRRLGGSLDRGRVLHPSVAAASDHDSPLGSVPRGFAFRGRFGGVRRRRHIAAGGRLA